MKNGTDHLSFIPYGVPGFNLDQDPRGYFHTHHSQSDTYDKAIPEDLRQAMVHYGALFRDLLETSEVPKQTERECSHVPEGDVTGSRDNSLESSQVVGFTVICTTLRNLTGVPLRVAGV